MHVCLQICSRQESGVGAGGGLRTTFLQPPVFGPFFFGGFLKE